MGRICQGMIHLRLDGSTSCAVEILGLSCIFDASPTKYDHDEEMESLVTYRSTPYTYITGTHPY